MGYNSQEATGKSTASLTGPGSAVEDGSGGDTMIKRTGYVSGGETGSSKASFGIKVDATVKGFDKGPLPGEAKIKQGKDVAASKSNSNIDFSISASEPSGVTDGSDKPLAGQSFRYEPFEGTPTEKTNLLSSGWSVSVTFEYGAVEGTITDVDGNPVSADTVEEKDAGVTVTTDSDGKYRLQSAGNVTLSALYGSEEQDVNITKFSTTTQDFQYAGFDITVVLSDGTAVPGARVTVPGIRNPQRTTDTGGAIRYTEVPPNETKTVDLVDGISKDFTFLDQGKELTFQQKLQDGAKGSLADAVSGKIPRNLKIEFVPLEQDHPPFVSFAADNGEFAIGTTLEGKHELRIGEGDRRYETYTQEVEARGTGKIVGLQGLRVQRENVEGS